MRILNMMQNLVKLLLLWTLTTSLTSCSQSKKTKISSTNDSFCFLYIPLNTELDSEVVKYWKEKSSLISIKNAKGGIKTAEERFFETTINQIGGNDKKYYSRCSGN